MDKTAVPDALSGPYTGNIIGVNKVIGAHAKLPQGRGKFCLHF